jgi:hypothetical protein
MIDLHVPNQHGYLVGIPIFRHAQSLYKLILWFHKFPLKSNIPIVLVISPLFWSSYVHFQRIVSGRAAGKTALLFWHNGFCALAQRAGSELSLPLKSVSRQTLLQPFVFELSRNDLEMFQIEKLIRVKSKSNWSRTEKLIEVTYITKLHSDT